MNQMLQTRESSRETQERMDHFIEYLGKHREDRTVMAALRRGLAQPRSPEVSRIVQCQLSENSPHYLEDAYYSIGPLFAFHHEFIADKGNMGNHFRDMCEDPENPPSSIERRFMQLLSSDAGDLDDLLRQAVSLLKSKDIPINWQELLNDIIDWKYSEDRQDFVRRKWSRAFWRSR